MIKRILKFLGVLLGMLTLSLVVWAFIVNEPLPKGETGTAADALAHKMLTALNYKSYKETRFLEWSFRNNSHHYKWDKHQGKVDVTWGNHEVFLNLIDPKKSDAFSAKKAVKGAKANAIIHKALDKFNNDSFWLVAPYKVFDTGTARSIIKLEDGTKGLLVTYSTGGTTPGDSYLWKLDSNGFPYAFKMWVGIIPVGGIQASWDDWKQAATGTYLPESHKLGPLNLKLDNIKTY